MRKTATRSIPPNVNDGVFGKFRFSIGKIT